MQIRTSMTVSAGALLIASSVWSGSALAQTSSFQTLQPGSARFQIIGGGSPQLKPSHATPPTKPLRNATRTEALQLSALSLPATSAAAAGLTQVAMAPAAPLATAVPAAVKPVTARETEIAGFPPPAPLDEAARVTATEPPAETLAPSRKVARPDAIVTASITPAPVRQMEVMPAGDENVRLVRRGNALLDEANRRARDSLDLFVRMANNPPEGAGDFAVKVTLGPKDARESVWVSALERRMTRRFLILTSERWSGRLSNEPTQAIGHKLGDRVSFAASDIRDWTYRMADGRMMGNFTACALTAQEGPGKLAELVDKTRLDCGWIAEATKVAAR